MERDHDIILSEAAATFGSLHQGLKWLHSPCECMEQRIPADVAKSRDGLKEVLDVLYRIRGTIAHYPSPGSIWSGPKGRESGAERLWYGRRRWR